MRGKEVTIIDYGMGNLYSVMNALDYLGCFCTITSDPGQIKDSDYLILPGVGSFKKAMEEIVKRKIDDAVYHAVESNNSRILGICLGMQLLGEDSTEGGDTAGLCLIPNKVDKFSQEELANNRLPHVGYNSVKFSEPKGLFSGIADGAFFYFNHSYRMLVDGFSGGYATCIYGTEFLAAFESKTVFGTQFHPEKSQSNGLMLFKNFLES